MQEYRAGKPIGKKAPMNCLVLPDQHYRARLATQRYYMSFGTLIDRAEGRPKKFDGMLQEASLGVNLHGNGHSAESAGLATRHTSLQGFVYQNRLDCTMAIQKLAQGGRPSKGPRHTFVVKPDLARAEKLRAILEILGTNAVDYLTPLVAAHVDSVVLEELRNQEILPIPKAS